MPMDILDTANNFYERRHVSRSREDTACQSFPSNKEKDEYFVDDCKGYGELEQYASENEYNQPFDGCNISDPEAVVEHFDGMFRQRINSEIENFRIRINEIVSEQQMNFRSTFSLQYDGQQAQQVPMPVYSRSSSSDNINKYYPTLAENNCTSNESMSVSESPASTFNSYGTSESDKASSGFPPREMSLQDQRSSDEAIRDQYVIRLTTATLRIGNALRREEYRV